MPLCEDAHRFVAYFNKEETKQALGVRQQTEWTRCKSVFIDTFFK
jgi:hypothetical protein